MKNYKIIKKTEEDYDTNPFVRFFSEMTEEEQKEFDNQYGPAIPVPIEEEKLRLLKEMSNLFKGLYMPKGPTYNNEEFLKRLNDELRIKYLEIIR